MNSEPPSSAATCRVVTPEQIDEAAALVERGALVLMPTDTVYGIAAHPARGAAVANLCRAKGRDPHKPIPLLASSLEAVRRFGARWDETANRLARGFWPGPLTLVLRCRTGADEGFRVPDCAVARALVERCEGVLRVTSANRSGGVPAATVEEAVRALGEHAALAVDGGPVTGGVPSTVVRWDGTELEVLRVGAIPARKLHDLVGEETP